MKPGVVLAALVASASCASTPAPAAPAQPQAELTLETFEEPLAIHGEWIMCPRYGRVWHPLRVAAGWQPYLYGQWVWTTDGWFWITEEPWGWATYHYGRWAYDPVLGWLWVPGFAWAPAWVAWRLGDGFVGWAPLYPGFDEWWVDAYPLDPPHWIFVPVRSFVSVRVDLVAVPRARVPALVRTSRPAPPPSSGRPSSAPRLGGPPPSLVEKQIGRRLAPARIVSVPGPSDARRRSDPGVVPVYRPAPRVRAAKPTDVPAPPAPAPRRPEIAPAPERAPAPAPRPAKIGPKPERVPAAAPPSTAPAPARKAEDRSEKEARERPAPARPHERD